MFYLFIYFLYIATFVIVRV